MLREILPATLVTTSRADLEAIVGKSPPSRPKPRAVQNAKLATWKRQALAALDVGLVYANFLTGGRTPDGWLECRDPNSPTGDRSPSAGVADGSGKAERGSFHSFRTNTTVTVFDFLQSTGKAASFEEACAMIADLSGVELPVEEADEDSSKPTIVLDDDIPGILDKTEAAISRAGMRVFQRDRRLVRIAPRREKVRAPGIVRSANTLLIEAAPTVWLQEIASASAKWIRVKADGTSTPVRVQRWVGESLQERAEWTFKSLAGITTTPRIRLDGSIISEGGYDEATELYFEPGSTHFPPVPENPSRADVDRAIEVLCEPIVDYDFLEPCDKSAAIAAILTVGVRHLLDTCPLIAVRSPCAGAGKSKLVDIASLIWFGHPAARVTETGDEQEERKRLLAVCLAGDPTVLIDNVVGVLESCVLAAGLTGETVRDRVLGSSRMVSASMTGVWFATGINLLVGGDLTRRTIPIDISPLSESPEDRVGFRHAPLEAYVLAHRGELVSAAHVVLRAHLLSGASTPPAVAPFASFENWSALVRGAVLKAGLADPLRGCARLRRVSPMRLADVKLGVFQSWKNLIGLNNPKTTVELIREATDDPSEGEEVRVKRLDFRAALGRICPRFDGISLDSNTLGQKLNQLVGFVAGGMTIQEPPKTNVGRLWSLVEIAGDELQPPKSGDGRDGRDGGDGGDDRDLNQRPDEGVW